MQPHDRLHAIRDILIFWGVGLTMLRMDYTHTANDLPLTIVESDNLGRSWVTR